MRRVVTVGVLILFLMVGAVAQKRPPSMELQVLSFERAPSASLTHDLIKVKVRVKNVSQRELPTTNNRFVLQDTEGKSYLVSRPWYAQGKLLQPGASTEIDRVYFEIPKKRKQAALSLYWRRFSLGSVKL